MRKSRVFVKHHCSTDYVEMGLGVSFASIVKGLPVFKKKKLEFIFLSHFFSPEYICIGIRKDNKFTSFQDEFLEILLKT